MAKQETQIREKIIDVTIGLIKKYGDTSMITIRGIASEAGVGVAMINYHFQTKDNLINLCLLKTISQTLEHFESINQSSEMKAIDKIRELGKGIATFMIINPGVSRISITNDIVSANLNDNSVQVTKMLFPIIKEIYGDKKNDQELLILLHMLISSIEVGFLRKDVIKETIGLDFTNTEQRDKFIEFCINQIISE